LVLKILANTTRNQLVSFRCRTLLLIVLVSSPGVPAAVVAAQENAVAPSAAGQAEKDLDNDKRIALEAQRMAEADPSEDNLFQYASSLMQLNYPSAEIIYRFAVGKYPDSVRLHAGLASALEGQSQFDEAANEFYRASELAPTDPHPLEFLVAGKYIPSALAEKVLDGLRRLRRLYPNDGLILFDYEMALSNRYTDHASPAPPDFVPMVKKAIRLTPQLPEAYFQLSLVYEDKKQYVQEVEALRRAVQLSPRDARFRFRLAIAYKSIGKSDLYLREMSAFKQIQADSAIAAP
jgi:tetratricopeptide (TPR) repeat protein